MLGRYPIRRSVFLLTMAFGLANGQTKPSLNGVWKMDPAKSDLGPARCPRAAWIRSASKA